MSDAITLLGATLRADAEALRMTSDNVANLQTAGYRREVSVMQMPFDALAATHGAGGELALLAPTIQSSTDYRTGSMQQGSSPWHMAIEGEGYFVLSTPTGEQVTRRGDFSLDAT